MNTYILNHFANTDFNILLLLGLSLLAGTLSGRLSQKVKAPQVVAYIILGIIAGKSGFGLIKESTLTSFEPFNNFALGLIGFMIGGELKIPLLKKYGRQFITILFLEALSAFLVVTVLIFIIAYYISRDVIFSTAVSLLLGSISSATAAAGTTDVIRESKAKGPLTSTILGIVALDDVLALLLFAVSASFIVSLSGSGESSLLSSIAVPLYEISAAVIIGLITGYLLSVAVLHYSDHERILIFLLGGILSVIGFSLFLNIDSIMACMITGFVISNKCNRKSDEVFHLIDRFAPPIYILFFILVGASLDIAGINLAAFIILTGYIAGRSIGKMSGSKLGAIISKSPPSVVKYLPLTLFSQSGVAIGLSILALHKFPGNIGQTIAVVVTASTFVVQLIGPLFVKYALFKANETGVNITEEDIIAKTKAYDFTSINYPVIYLNDNLGSILHKFSESEHIYFPVVDTEKKLKGIISVNEIKESFLFNELIDLIAAVDIMEPVNKIFPPQTPMRDVIQELKNSNLDYIAVCNSGLFEGIIESRTIQRIISAKIMECQNKCS